MIKYIILNVFIIIKMEKENDKAQEGEKNENQIEEIKPLSEQDFIKNDDPKQIISDLTNKIILLEKVNNDLKAKNENLIKNNFKNKSLGLKSSLIGMKLGLASQILMKKANSDSSKLADMIKEKEDLQEINEKMLDLLTEKELENEDLMEKLKNYELKSKLEIEQNEEKIRSLEEKLKFLEDSKDSNTQDIDDIINEYTSFQEKLKLQIKELSSKEEELIEQNNLKETTIQKLSEEITDLQIKIYQLKTQSEKMEKIQEREYYEQDKLISENNLMKKNNEYLNEKIKLMEENIKKINKSKEEDISILENKLQEEKDYLKTYKQSKAEEIIKLKNQINKSELDIKFLSDKINQNEKNINQEKEKSYIYQTNLEKKTKEIKEINEYSKKLLANKDNIITQYEEKISEMAKEKNELISQNKELIDKLKTKTDEITPMKSLENLLNEEEEKENLEFYAKENKLLNEEINGLKEQLAAKGKDTSEIKSLNEENLKLKIKNEEILNENEGMKSQLDEYKKQELKNKLLLFKKKTTENAAKLRGAKRDMDKINYEKQINALKQLKEEEKKNYESQMKKLRMEIAIMKMKNAKQKALINNTNEKIKNLGLKNDNINEINQEQNYFVYAALILFLFILFFLDTKI